MDTIDGLMKKVTGWIDSLFAIFGLYTSKYSKLIVYGLLIFLVSRMLKINLKLGGKH